MVAHTYNFRIWEAETGGSEVQSYFQPYRLFEASLGNETLFRKIQLFNNIIGEKIFGLPR